MASLELLFCKNRKSAKLEFHNTVSLELPFLWTSILIKKLPDPCPILQLQRFHKSINNLKTLQFSEVRNSTKHTLFTYDTMYDLWTSIQQVVCCEPSRDIHLFYIHNHIHSCTADLQLQLERCICLHIQQDGNAQLSKNIHKCSQS